MPAKLYQRLMAAMQVPDLEIPTTCVKLYPHTEAVPTKVRALRVDEETLMSCQATRHASQGHPVFLDATNIGCVAAAISLGLVDQQQSRPMEQPPRLYTNVMHEQSGLGDHFHPPAPSDFSSGLVYACQHAGRPEFGLFGADDAGRFKDVETAQQALQSMMAIQPPTMQGVLFFPAHYNAVAVVPDVVVMAVRPVELTRLLQGYQYLTGRPVQAVMNPLRVVDSDLIARPFLTGEINFSSFCLGARVLGRFEADRMGLGIPFDKFKILVDGVERSRTGYPFELYPGADPKQ